MAKKEEYQVKYTGFTPRNYVVALYDNPHNKPLIDPASFFFARFYLTGRSKLEGMLAGWPSARQQLIERCEPVFELDGKYLLHVGDKTAGGKPKRTRKTLAEITNEQRVANTREAIRRRYSCYNMFDDAVPDIFFLNDEEWPERRPHAGDIWLSSGVKPKSGGHRNRRLHQVRVAGPYDSSANQFGHLFCDCEDSTYAREKQGYTHGELLCTDIAALLELARYNPSRVRNLQAVRERRDGIRAWMPFHAFEAQPFTEKVVTSKMGLQPDLEFLTIDALFEFAFNNSSKFNISKQLSRLPTIYHRLLKEKLHEGNGGFEVIANKYIFERSNPIAVPVRQWFDRMDGYLTSQGYSFSGLVLEKKGTEYETVAMHYEKGGESVRLLFSPDHPPIAVRRWPRKDQPVRLFYEESHTRGVSKDHPFAELFQPKQQFDDQRKIITNYEVFIPTGIWLPDEIVADYNLAIRKHTPGGPGYLVDRVYRRNGIMRNAGRARDVIVDKQLVKIKTIAKTKKFI